MSSSDSDSEVEVKKQNKSTTKKNNKKQKDEDISSSSDEDLEILGKKTNRKASNHKEQSQKKSTKKQKKESSSESDSESSSEKPKKVAKKEQPQKKQKKESSSESDSESSNEKPKKNSNKKKESSSESDSESSKEKPKKNVKKEQQKKNVQKNSKKDSDDENSSDEEPRAKPTAKKEDSDSDDDESSSKKENKKKSTKKNGDEKKEKSDEEDNDEVPENAFEELFVRNIGYDTTQETLGDYFMKYGDVEEAKICTDKQTNKSRGFGFVKFYDKKSAAKAMKDSENIVVDGRNLQIRYSNDKNGPLKGSNENHKKGNSEFGIFVGNISYKCTEKDLKNFFKDCGNVTDVRLAKKPDGKLKGFAHVDFDCKEAVDKAVEKNGKELQGRELKVDRSQGGSKGGNNGGNRGFGRGKGAVDPMDKAKKSGAIIKSAENKVTKYDDSDDDE